jgi:hypothetical protein
LGVKFAENDDAIKKNKLYQALNQSQAQKSGGQHAAKVTGELVLLMPTGLKQKPSIRGGGSDFLIAK